MSYRFLNPAPVFFTIIGGDTLDGGSWTFYDIGTTTPKTTWSDPALTIPNSNPVLLDSGGRLTSNVWLNGDYSAQLKDKFGAVVGSPRDITSGVPAGLTIPALAPGFLTNDLSNLLWQTIIQVPDPTGSADNILSTDGANIFWTPKPTAPVAPDPQIVVTTIGWRGGISTDPNKFLAQFGTGSAAASGSKATSVAVVFPTAFSAAPNIHLTPTNQLASNVVTRPFVSGASTTGFTANFSTLTGGTSADSFTPSNIATAVTFNWAAFGNVTVP